MESDAVVEAASEAGLRLLSHETFLTYQFLLVFGQDERPPPTDQAGP